MATRPAEPFSRPADRAVSLLRLLTVAAFALAAVVYVAVSWRWRMAVDTPVMHYVVFLLRHGLKPYSEITDNNMPGAYLSEAAAMSVFGTSDLAWRVYEFFLMGVLGLSAAALTRRWDWVAGVFGAGLFLALHSAEGPQLAVERELVIGVLLMASCALLVLGTERRLPWLLGVFGFLAGVVTSVKPTFLLLPMGLLPVAGWKARQLGERARPYLLWGVGGLVLASGLDVAFLLRFHAMGGFWFILTEVLPAYHGIQRMPLVPLLLSSMPRVVAFLCLLTLPLLAANLRSMPRRSWAWWILVAGAGFGLISFVAQGKGYVYHRYVFLMFLLVLLGVEIFVALRQRGWRPWWAAVTLCFALFVVVPQHLRHARAVVGQAAYELTLERDLRTLNAAQPLGGEVQCFDMVYGCLDALYHLDMVENSGFTGDMLLFSTVDSAPARYYRQRFWELAQKNPAEVLVVSNGVMAEPNNYGKLQRWPAFDSYLQQQYTLAVERHFPFERYTYRYPTAFPETEADSYRIYVRKGSALASTMPTLPAGEVAVAR